MLYGLANFQSVNHRCKSIVLLRHFFNAMMVAQSLCLVAEEIDGSFRV